jgi:hypothetical protein
MKEEEKPLSFCYIRIWILMNTRLYMFCLCFEPSGTQTLGVQAEDWHMGIPIGFLSDPVLIGKGLGEYSHSPIITSLVQLDNTR